MKTARILLQVIIMLLLFPASAMFLLGVFVAVLVHDLTSWFNVFLLASGYGLYSALWVCIKCHYITLREIPNHVWLGAIFGMSIASFMLISSILKGGINNNLPLQHQLGIILVFGGGPMISGTTALLLIQSNS